MTQRQFVQGGFSLLELAIVLFIVALLAGSMLPAVSARQNAMEQAAVRQQLDDIREALLGFAIRYGRLPCPAAPGSSGGESPENGGNCSHPWNGLLPAITLGIQPVDSKGYAVDPWGNPIRYAVSTFKNATCGSAPCLTSEDGLRHSWNSETPPAPDLHVCNAAAGASGSGGSAECASGSTLNREAVAVFFSTGRNGGREPAGADEIANRNNTRLFVAHAANAAPNEFDDEVDWLSPNIFYSRLLAAGRLP
ncbi:MAG: type II secretion system protein [Bacteroidota bacterium]